MKQTFCTAKCKAAAVVFFFRLCISCPHVHVDLVRDITYSAKTDLCIDHHWKKQRTQKRFDFLHGAGTVGCMAHHSCSVCVCVWWWPSKCFSRLMVRRERSKDLGVDLLFVQSELLNLLIPKHD